MVLGYYKITKIVRTLCLAERRALHESMSVTMVVTSRFLFPRHISKPLNLGPLHMSPVTRLARLPGPILLSVHMGNFSPVDRDEIQETKPKWWTYTCIVLGFRSCVNSSNFTYKANLHTPKVEIHTRQKLCHFGCYVAKAKLFCLKSFVPVTRPGVFIWENFHPGYQDLVCKSRYLGNRASPASHMNTSKFVPRKEWRGRDLGNRAISVNRAHMKRP